MNSADKFGLLDQLALRIKEVIQEKNYPEQWTSGYTQGVQDAIYLLKHYGQPDPEV